MYVSLKNATIWKNVFTSSTLYPFDVAPVDSNDYALATILTMNNPLNSTSKNWWKVSLHINSIFILSRIDMERQYFILRLKAQFTLFLWMFISVLSNKIMLSPVMLKIGTIWFMMQIAFIVSFPGKILSFFKVLFPK